MGEQALDLRSAGAALRRRVPLLVAAGVLGLVAAVAFVLLQPPRFVSTTLVLLPTPSADAPQPSVDTQVQIVRSSNVLAQGAEGIRPAPSARELERRVRVSAPTEQLVRIQASAASASEAQRLSQGVADSYVGYVETAARNLSTTALGSLQQRRKTLQAQFTALQEEIASTTKRRELGDPKSSEARKDAQLLAQLQAEQADVSLQIDRLADRIEADAPAGAATMTSVIQSATPGKRASLFAPLLVAVPIGVVGGVLLASALVLVLARRDPRLRHRDAIADAVGSSVLGTVRSRPQRSVAGWSGLLEKYAADPVDAWAFRQVLRALAPADARRPEQRHPDPRHPGAFEHPRSVTVLSLSGDERGLAVGPQLAAFAASLGIRTRLVTAAGSDGAAALWSACSARRTTPPRPGLIVGEVRPDESADLTVVLVVIDRREPDLRRSLRTAGTLLSVGAGAATEEELARVAVAVDDAGRRIDGVVVADAERSDRTTGRYTLDERARQIALPVRLTGVGAGVGGFGAGAGAVEPASRREGRG